jgi:hypothetical protein
MSTSREPKPAARSAEEYSSCEVATPIRADDDPRGSAERLACPAQYDSMG